MADYAQQCMRHNVQPISDAVFRRPLPGLKTVAVREVVCWFPEIECLVAVLDGVEQCCKQCHSKEHSERIDGLYNKEAWSPIKPINQ